MVRLASRSKNAKIGLPTPFEKVAKLKKNKVSQFVIYFKFRNIQQLV
jgi:hypothetical protein